MNEDDTVSRLSDAEWVSLRRYLLDHPDLITQDFALLKSLNLTSSSKRLIEFGPAALARLEARAVRDFDARRRLENTMRANFDAQTEAHELVLSLLDARHHADLAFRLNEGAQKRFGLVCATVGLEDTSSVPLGWKSLADGGVDYILGEQCDSLLGPDAVCRVLFDDDVSRVKSAAVLRLQIGREAREGLIAFGSHSFEGFNPDMGIELVLFVARAVEKIAARWPILTQD